MSFAYRYFVTDSSDIADPSSAAAPIGAESTPAVPPVTAVTRPGAPATPLGQDAVPEVVAEKPYLWLRRADQIFVAMLVTVCLLLMVGHWFRLSHGGSSPVEISRLPASHYEYRLDMNRATWVEWAELEGIGETLARRIVAYRETSGPFTSIDQIRKVKGIGPKKLEQIRPYLEVSADGMEKSRRGKHAATE